MRALLKENMANYSFYYIVGKVNKCRLWEKYKLSVSSIQFRKRKSQTTVCHSIELIGYQIQAHGQNKCTVLITKGQSLKVCEHFSIF